MKYYITNTKLFFKHLDNTIHGYPSGMIVREVLIPDTTWGQNEFTGITLCKTKKLACYNNNVTFLSTSKFWKLF